MTDHTRWLRELLEVEALEHTLDQGGVAGLLDALEQAITETPAGVEHTFADGTRVGRSALKAVRAVVLLDRAHLEQHADGLFACLINRLHWHDAPEAAAFYAGDGPWSAEGAKLCALAARWRAGRPEALWLRSLRPPAERLERAGTSMTLRGNEAQVDVLALGPGLLAAGGGGWGWVWDLESGALRRRLDLEEAGDIRGLAFSTDGERLATGTGDHTARVWDLTGGALVWEAGSHEGQVTSVAFAPDGRLAVGNLGWTARVYDVEGTELTVYSGHRQSVLALAVAPNGEAVASAASDGTVQVWDARSGDRRALLGDEEAVTQVAEAGPEESVYGDPVEALAYAPDGARLAACVGGAVRVWQASDWSEVARLEPEGGPVTALAWLADGRLALACYQALEVWDVERAHPVLSEALDPRRNPSAVTRFFADGRAAQSCPGGAVRVWTPGADDSAPRPLDAPRVLGLDADPGSGRVVARVGENYAPERCLLDLDSARLVALPSLPSFQTPPDPVTCARALRMAVAAEPGYGDPPEYALLDLERGVQLSRFGAQDLVDPERPYVRRELHLHPDGRRVLAVHHRRIGVWDGLTGTRLGTLGWTEDGEVEIDELRFACGGRYLIAQLRPEVFRGDAPVRVWSLDDGSLVAELEVGEGRLNAVAVQEAAGLAVAARANGRIDSRELSDAGQGPILLGKTPARALAFSPDGAWLAAAGPDGIQLWELATGEVRRTLPEDLTRQLVWSPDGLLAIGFERAAAWDPEQGTRRGEVRWVEGTDPSGVWVVGDGAVIRGLDLRPLTHFPRPLEGARWVGGDRIVGVDPSTQAPCVYALEGAGLEPTRAPWSEPPDPTPFKGTPPGAGRTSATPRPGRGGHKPKGFQRF